MSKFNVGDKVRIKDNIRECKHGCNPSMLNCKGKIGAITSINDNLILLDVDNEAWCWSENVLELIEEEETMKMRRIDYLLNAKDNIQAILDETVLDCDICPSSCKDCNGDCEFYYKKYLNEEIEVDKSDLKDTDVESTVEAIKNTKEENDPVNPFMEEYKKIVTETMDLCEKKNKDYGSSVQDTFLRFGDLSYLTRITDKYNRILTLINKDNEVKDENLIDTIRDMGNYCFLWLASRNLNE